MSARRFPPHDQCLGAVRHFLHEQTADQAPQVTEAVVLLGNELATNVVRHAGTEFEIDVVVSPDTTVVTVSDGSSVPPRLVENDPYSTGGRGLRIVAALADDWGMRHTDQGKQVWFEVATRATPTRPMKSGTWPGAV
ncbi:MAG: ATP-binding protein [Acidimicrobiales bacterium]